MYHLKSNDDIKEFICTSYQNPSGNLCVVLCSSSVSMGLDVKAVDTVVYFGPASDFDDYQQETGRAGRDPNRQRHAILLLYNKGFIGSRNII